MLGDCVALCSMLSHVPSHLIHAPLSKLHNLSQAMQKVSNTHNKCGAMYVRFIGLHRIP